MVGETARELEHRLGRRVVVDQRRIAAPSYLDSGEQIGLGPGEPVEPGRLEQGLGAENLGVGDEGQGGASAVRGRPSLLERRGRLAAREGLAVELLVAGDLDDRLAGQSVDHAHSDAVKPARGRIGLAREFTARMEHRQDHLERRLARIARMRIDRDTAAIVADGQAGCRPRGPSRSEWRIRPRPRPSHCRGLRRQDGEVPARRCRRYTFRAAGGRVRAPPAPRSNGHRNRRGSGGGREQVGHWESIGGGESRCQGRAVYPKDVRRLGVGHAKPEGKRRRPCSWGIGAADQR